MDLFLYFFVIFLSLGDDFGIPLNSTWSTLAKYLLTFSYTLTTFRL